jgi:hypothetical protein
MIFFEFFQALESAVDRIPERESEIPFFCSFLYFDASVRKIAPQPELCVNIEVGKVCLAA